MLSSNVDNVSRGGPATPCQRSVPGFYGFSLRAKFVLAIVLVTTGLTGGALLIIRDRVTRHVHQQVDRDLNNSSEYLRSFEKRRDDLIERTVNLVADTPLLKALMTTRDAATIQDGTSRIADASGADLFVVSDPSGKSLGLHGRSLKANAETVSKPLDVALTTGRQRDWWLVNGKLYEVVVTPIYVGEGRERVDVGFLAWGLELDSRFVREIATLTDSEVVIRYNETDVVSTTNLAVDKVTRAGVHEMNVGNERYLAREVAFGEEPDSPVLVLLKSYDKATEFIVRLNWIVIAIGIFAILVGAGLAFIISDRFTMPMRELLTGVQALEEGEFEYPLHPRGHDESGQLTAAFARMRETLKTTQEQLLRSARMEALGRLAGGVAHDFNNIITIISGYGELALDQTANNPELKSYVEEIRKAGTRATGLTRQLLAFSRKQILQPQPLDLNSVLTNINKMLRVLIGEDVHLVLSLSARVPAIMADPGQIEQVVMNLAANARDAMPSGGTLTVATNICSAADVPIAASDRTSDGYVVFSVSDTGTGMNAETVKHIFEPFFTTKAAGRGTGLGLATVYGIVQQSGGTIDVQSEPGKGTTFRIFLPAVEKRAAFAAEGLHETYRAVGTGVVLIVEDEEPVRRLAITGLADRGYTVLSASNGREALRVIESQTRNIDLVVTDVIMPEMGGRDLFKALQKAYPHIKVLFVSGYTDRSLNELGVELETSLLPKPFTPQTLAQKVKEMLDRGAHAVVS
jgi:signal transduction histidine kinase